MEQTNLTVHMDEHIKQELDDYYSGERLNRVLHSVAQAERGELVTKSLAELEAMTDE